MNEAFHDPRHAANERTFLAWVRTGIAVIAFGFVVEKFNLFVLAMADASAPDAGPRLLAERLSGPFGRYDGLALILVGLALVIVAAARFVRTAQLVLVRGHTHGGMTGTVCYAPEVLRTGVKSLAKVDARGFAARRGPIPVTTVLSRQKRRPASFRNV